MNRVLVYFIDLNTNSINIEGTDIFERGEYLHIYNGNNLVGVILASTVKIMYQSTKRD